LTIPCGKTQKGASGQQHVFPWQQLYLIVIPKT